MHVSTNEVLRLLSAAVQRIHTIGAHTMYRCNSRPAYPSQFQIMLSRVCEGVQSMQNWSSFASRLDLHHNAP